MHHKKLNPWGHLSFSELLFNAIKKPYFEDRSCLVDTQTNRMLTYGDLNKASASAAGMFRWFGVRPGETVSLLFDQTCHFFIPFVGAIRMGAVPHPVCYEGSFFMLSTQGIVASLRMCNTKVLVAQKRFLYDAKNNGPTLLMELLKNQLPHLPILIVGDELDEKMETRLLSKIGGFTYNWDALAGVARKMKKEFLDVEKQHPRQPLLLINNGGWITNRRAIEQVEDTINDFLLTEDDRTLVTQSITDPNTLVTTFFPMTLLGGATLLMPLSHDIRPRLLATIGKWHATYAGVTAPQLFEVINGPIQGPAAYKNFRFFVGDHGMVSQELKDALEQKHGIHLLFNHRFCRDCLDL